MTRAEYGPRPSAEHRPSDPPMAPTMADACMRVSRSRDALTYACARPVGHAGDHYGMTRSGPVRLGYGAGGY